MPDVIGTLFAIAWFNPYTEQPDGAPRVLAEYFVPGHVTQTPEPLRTFLHTLGGGYSTVLAHFHGAIRRLPPESLASIRQKRLKARLEKSVPMFADQLYAQMVAKKEAYYQGITDAPIAEARQQQEDEYAERLEFLQAHANELIVYAQEPPACVERARQLREEMEAVKARFHVQPGQKRWLCRHCTDGKWQDAIALYRALTPSASFEEAVRALAGNVAYVRAEAQPTPMRVSCPCLAEPGEACDRRSSTPPVVQ